MGSCIGYFGTDDEEDFKDMKSLGMKMLYLPSGSSVIFQESENRYFSFHREYGLYNVYYCSHSDTCKRRVIVRTSDFGFGFQIVGNHDEFCSASGDDDVELCYHRILYGEIMSSDVHEMTRFDLRERLAFLIRYIDRNQEEEDEDEISEVRVVQFQMRPQYNIKHVKVPISFLSDRLESLDQVNEEKGCMIL